MEGPSLVILTEELKDFFGKKVVAATGSSQQIPFKELKNTHLNRARSWGKHLLLLFKPLILKVHFLMWGSYRINSRRAGRKPRLRLKFENGFVDFYSCSIKPLDKEIYASYDWSADTMSKKWDPKKALQKLNSVKKNSFICDLLMDQRIFAGVGNIIKNEVLFILKMHPETKIKDLTLSEKKNLIKETRAYCLKFYKWKKIFQLKRHWKIMRKRECPDCGSKVIRRETGIGMRLSHWCPNCQKLPTISTKNRKFRDKIAA